MYHVRCHVTEVVGVHTIALRFLHLIVIIYVTSIRPRTYIALL